MKNKKFNKKLVLNKHTVSDLSAAEQTEVRGGAVSLITCVGYCDTDQSCAPTVCPACDTWYCSDVYCTTPDRVCIIY